MHSNSLHWNRPGALHAVGLWVLIKLPAGTEYTTAEGVTFMLAYDSAIKARRDQILEDKEHLRVYKDAHGNTFTGMYEWTYP